MAKTQDELIKLARFSSILECALFSKHYEMENILKFNINDGYQLFRSTNWSERLLVIPSVVISNVKNKSVFKGYQLVNITMHTTMNKVIMRSRPDTLSTKFRTEIVLNLDLTCDDTHYGEHCKLFCDSNTKVCEEAKECYNPWLRSHVNLIFQTENCETGELSSVDSKVLQMCLIYDSCFRDVICNESESCLLLENHSAICISYPVIYKSSLYPDIVNITHSFITVNELWTVSKVNSLNSQVSSDDEEIYIIEIFGVHTTDELLLDKANNTFRLIENIFCENCQVIRVNILIKLMKIYRFSALLNLSIIQMPTECKWNLTEIFIFVGQKIVLTCDAWPLKYLYYNSTLVTDNFYFSKYYSTASSILIPMVSSLGSFIINTTVTFAPPNYGRNTTLYSSVKSNIRAFTYYGFQPNNRKIFLMSERLFCNYSGFSRIQVHVFQVNGETQLKPHGNSVYLNTTMSGGIYSFLCHAHFNLMTQIFIRYKTIFVYAPPKEMCIQEFPVVPGAFISCHHNGYPSDAATVTIRIYNKNSQLISTQQNFARLPFKIRSMFYTIKCYIRYQLTIRRFFQYTHDINKFVKFSEYDADVRVKESLNCQRFPFLPFIELIQTKDKRVEFVIELFFLKDSDSSSVFYIILPIIYLLIVDLFLVLYTYLLIRDIRKGFIDSANEVKKHFIRVRSAELHHLLTDKMIGVTYKQRIREDSMLHFSFKEITHQIHPVFDTILDSEIFSSFSTN